MPQRGEKSIEATRKPTDATSTTSQTSSLELDRNESGVRKVDIASLDVSSIITQVDRNQAEIPQQPNRINRTKAQGRTPRRSFFSRLLCCAPKGLSNGANHTSEAAMESSRNTSATVVRTNPGHKRPTTPTGSRGRQQFEQVPSNKPYVKKCLALDLDETLVHSSFQPVERPSFVLTIVIEGVKHSVYVIKRPGVDEFLQRLSEYYELIVYTASLSKYADPLLDLLDPKKTISRRLFRENCVFYDGHYVKDLSLLGREISQTIIVDNCNMSYIFHPDNAIGCSSFFDDPADVELWQIADFLEHIKGCEDVRAYCNTWKQWCQQHSTSGPNSPKR